eukprot:229326-Amorphochlora_amoeboformis.AAC.1
MILHRLKSASTAENSGSIYTPSFPGKSPGIPANNPLRISEKSPGISLPRIPGKSRLTLRGKRSLGESPRVPEESIPRGFRGIPRPLIPEKSPINLGKKERREVGGRGLLIYSLF